jgi:hypothetical protein
VRDAVRGDAGAGERPHRRVLGRLRERVGEVVAVIPGALEPISGLRGSGEPRDIRPVGRATSHDAGVCLAGDVDEQVVDRPARTRRHRCGEARLLGGATRRSTFSRMAAMCVA